MIQNQYPNSRYMFATRVASVGAGSIVDTSGRVLRLIGNYPVNPGSIVYTDGEIVYGHVPFRQQIELYDDAKGIPVYCWGGLDGQGAIIGYCSLDGAFHKYTYKSIVHTPVPSQMLNDTKKFFYDAVFHYGQNGHYPVDIEVDSDGGGYYAAVGDSGSAESVRAYHVFDAQYTNGGELASGNVMRDDSIEIYHITKAKEGYSYSLIQRIDLHDYLPSLDYLVEKFNEYQSADSAPTENPIRLDSLVTQLVDFRFVDREGKWEMILAGFATGKLLVDYKTQSQYWFSRNIEINFSKNVLEEKQERVGSLPIGTVSEGLYIADVYAYKVTVIGNAGVVITDADSPDSKDLPTDIQYRLVHVIEKIKSDGTREILQKRVKRGVSKYADRNGRGAYRLDTQTITGGAGWINYSGEYSYKEYRFTSPYHADGAYNVLGLTEPLEAHGTMYSTPGFSMRNRKNEELPEDEDVDAEPFEVNLGNGYTAMSDGMRILSITSENGELVIEDQPLSSDRSYWLEPIAAPYANYPTVIEEPKIQLNGRTITTNNAIRHYSDGAEVRTTNDHSYPCFCNARTLSFYDFPHASVGKLKNGWLISILHDKLYKLLKGEREGEQAGSRLTEMGFLSVNYRLNEARNVRNLKL